MKNAIITAAVILFCTGTGSAQFNTDEERVFGAFVDPTFSDTGSQLGFLFRKEMEWGFIEPSLSVYPDLGDVGYTDIVISGGLMFQNDRLSYYIGPRLGLNWRDRILNFKSTPYPMAGGLMGIEYNIYGSMRIGVRAWIDHREDQEDQFFGDSDAYEPGLITNSPLLQENGAGYIIWTF